MPSRHRKLDAVVSRLQLQYGVRALRRANAAETRVFVPRIPTAFAALDAALVEDGQGGVPRGRITEIIGPATSGKVTLAAKVLAGAHLERGALAAWVDMSRTCDPDYLHRCGVDLNRLLVVRPEDRGDALTIAVHLVESGTLSAMVLDGLFGPDPGAGEEASGTLERLAASAAVSATTAILFLSEPQEQYQTLAHVAAVRLSLSRERWLVEHGDVRGYEGRVVILKNKLGRFGNAVPIRITFNGTVKADGLR